MVLPWPGAAAGSPPERDLCRRELWLWGHSGSGGSSSTLCFCWQLLLDAERHVLRQTVVKRLTECVDLLLLSGKGKNMLRIRLLLPFCTKQELLHVLDLGTPISAAFPAWHGSLFLLIGKWQ